MLINSVPYNIDFGNARNNISQNLLQSNPTEG